MNEGERTVFLSALKNGVGLSKASLMINKSAKEISLTLQKDNKFYKECLDNIVEAYKLLLVIANSYVVKKEYESWKKTNELIRSFVFKLVLWEEYSTKIKLTDRILLKAVVVYKYNEEIATACGLTLDEFAELLIEKEYLTNKILSLRQTIS